MTKWFFQDDKDVGLIIPEEFSETQSKGSALALGYFDGMHRGHQKVFSEMKAYADRHNITSVAQTFSGIPKSKVIKSKGHGLLTTIEEKYELMREAGADSVVLFSFSEHFSSVSAHDFFEKYIVALFEPKALVVGHDYRFGKGREGDVKTLQKWGKKYGIGVIVVSPEIYRGQVISSSWVRERILSADLEMTSILLGRMISYSGRVVSGRKLGRNLGFPTANIYPDKEKIVPPHGVYISFVKTESGIFDAVTNIGTRPTISDNAQDKDVVIETVILDQDMNLYDKNIKVYLAKKMREEKRFDDIGRLAVQIQIDMDKAREDHTINRHLYASFF